MQALGTLCIVSLLLPSALPGISVHPPDSKQSREVHADTFCFVGPESALKRLAVNLCYRCNIRRGLLPQISDSAICCEMHKNHECSMVEDGTKCYRRQVV